MLMHKAVRLTWPLILIFIALELFAPTPAQAAVGRLTQLTRAADIIAEVEVTAFGLPDPENHWREDHLTVGQWLKRPDLLTDPDLTIFWPPWDQPYITAPY